MDDGPPFDPTRHPVDPSVSPLDPPVGGRGLLMIRRIMDEIRYERRDGKNVLRLTKSQAFTGV